LATLVHAPRRTPPRKPAGRRKLTQPLVYASEHVLDGRALRFREAVQALPRLVGVDLRKLGGQAGEVAEGALLFPAVQGWLDLPVHEGDGNPGSRQGC
jgi:hypothetical protein